MTGLIYLASTPFTGSTLTSILLGSHPDIATISELSGVVASVDTSDYKCSCGSLFIECEFFAEVARQFSVSNLEFSYQNFQTSYTHSNELKQKLLYGSLHSSRLELVRDQLRKFWPGCTQFIRTRDLYNQTFIRVISDMSGKKYFLDASKGASRIPFLARSHDGPMYVVHITRDVRGFSNSSRKNSGRSVAASAKGWVRSHKDISRICQAENVSYGRFRYEDICRDTEKTIREIYAHCKLDSDVDVSFQPKDLHLLGNRMRLRSETKIRLDESWRTELSREEQNIAYDIGKDLMDSFGYSK